MKAACYESFKGPITITQLPDPVPAANEVIIRVKATGLYLLGSFQDRFACNI